MISKTFHFAIFVFLIFTAALHAAQVKVGIDRLFQDEYAKILKGKKIGVITNHTGIGSDYRTTIEILKANASAKNYIIAALFAPEHGLDGSAYADQAVANTKDTDAIPVYSLHGKTKRPTDAMLKNINVLIYDIQDIGSRSYTYISTLFYAMEEAAKRNITFIVLDRPNPINGLTVDGPMLDDKWRSAIGYINVPYCHGMTVGELARYFNGEYQIGCKLEVVPMKGWKREMSFNDTGLSWVPTSPYIPDASTPYFYPTTGILGEMKLVNIGIGYTLPFRVVGAPWINGAEFARQLNAQKFAGVHFTPFSFRPFYGRFAKTDCQGVLILVTDPLRYKPVSTQYLVLGMLKSLYPDKFQEAIEPMTKKKETLCKLNGSEEIYRIITEDKNIVWKLCGFQAKEREAYLKRRQKYLIADYAQADK